jgi:hypothetical protein
MVGPSLFWGNQSLMNNSDKTTKGTHSMLKTHWSYDNSSNQLIFSEHEKLLHDQLISLAECQLAESGKMQNKTEEMGIIGIDSSIHQQIIENTSKVKSSRYS